jgi:hypothetical protein
MGTGILSDKSACADRRGLQRASMVDEEGLQRLAEIVDQVKAIHHLHRLGCPRRMPSAYRSLRPRQTTVIVGCWASQAATLAAERSGSRRYRVSWSTTYSCSTVTSVRRTVQDGGSKPAINVWSS